MNYKKYLVIPTLILIALFAIPVYAVENALPGKVQVQPQVLTQPQVRTQVPVQTITPAPNRATRSADTIQEKVSARAIAKLMSILPRRSGIIEPKLGRYNLRGNEPTGSQSYGYGDGRTKWTGNVDGCEVRINSYEHKIGIVLYTYRSSYMNIAKTYAAIIAKLGRPNGGDGNSYLEYKK